MWIARHQPLRRLLCGGVAFTATGTPTMGLEKEQPHIKAGEHLICFGKVGSYSVGIAGRSIGSGNSMCYFIFETYAGKEISKTCSIGASCKVIGTAKDDQDTGLP
jgi:hypothetical protein